MKKPVRTDSILPPLASLLALLLTAGCGGKTSTPATPTDVESAMRTAGAAWADVDSAGNCLHGNTVCVTETFQRISKFYRPSGSEDALAGYIQGLVDELNDGLWRGQLESQHDAYGNVVVRVPATGVWFEHAKLPPIALQAHMDMVVQVKSDNEQALLDQLQTVGVLMETVDGYFQSVNHQTTLGADNGIGVSLALRYLFDRTLPHPALELLFSVEEESGLVGAMNFKIPLSAPVLINLDWEVPGVVGIGGLGGNRGDVTGAFTTSSLDANAKFLQVRVADLRGGHSGLDIDKPRANAVKLLAWVVENQPDSRIVNGLVGVRDASGVPTLLNAIPKTFDLTLAFPADALPDAAALKSAIQSYVWTNFEDERASSTAGDISASVTVQEITPSGAGQAISTADTQAIAAAVKAAPNGVLTLDATFPSGWRTSSNLGFFELKPVTDGAKLEVAYLTRSYDMAELEVELKDIGTALLAAWSTGAGTYTELGGYAPWLGRADDWLVKLALTQSDYFTKAEYASGGLEVGIYLANTEYCPNLKSAIAIGPELLEVHSVNERLRLDTIAPLEKALQRLLLDIGTSSQFQQ